MDMEYIRKEELSRGIMNHENTGQVIDYVYNIVFHG